MSLFVVHINQKKGPSSSGSITYGELLVDWALSIGKVSYEASVFYVPLTLQVCSGNNMANFKDQSKYKGYHHCP